MVLGCVGLCADTRVTVRLPPGMPPGMPPNMPPGMLPGVPPTLWSSALACVVQVLGAGSAGAGKTPLAQTWTRLWHKPWPSPVWPGADRLGSVPGGSAALCRAVRPCQLPGQP